MLRLENQNQNENVDLAMQWTYPMLERFRLLVSGSVRFLRGTLTLHCNLHVGHLFPNPPKTAIWNIAY